MVLFGMLQLHLWTIARYPVSHGIPNMCHGHYHAHQGRFPIATGGFCLALASWGLCVGGAQPLTACLKDAHNFGVELTDFQYPFGIFLVSHTTCCYLLHPLPTLLLLHCVCGKTI